MGFSGEKKNKESPSFQPLSSAGRVSGPMRFGLYKPMILMMEVASLLPPDGRSGWMHFLGNDGKK